VIATNSIGSSPASTPETITLNAPTTPINITNTPKLSQPGTTIVSFTTDLDHMPLLEWTWRTFDGSETTGTSYTEISPGSYSISYTWDGESSAGDNQIRVSNKIGYSAYSAPFNIY
jgi:hypothetical protein